ncbi:MAG: glycosyltransferase family 9 protein [Bacteroidota bacterium]
MRFLIIQTAFLGDVILATSIIEKLYHNFPDPQIDFLLRKGNESILENHPLLNKVLLLDKNKNKLGSILKIASEIRNNKYDYVINLHRFGSSGFVTWCSGAKIKIGFDKNPFSFCYTKKVKHEIKNGIHEIERNHELIRDFTDDKIAKPRIYPSENDFNEMQSIINNLPAARSIINQNYVCIAPASIWFTKQFPKEKWIELIKNFPFEIKIFLIGSKNDFELCEKIKLKTLNLKHKTVFNIAGKISLLQTAALMKNAQMNYVNDSAPMHIASAMNIQVTAIFCSTIPAYGFGPLSDKSKIIETKEKFDCRPCGLHGHNVCPEKHFKCAHTIKTKDILNDETRN